jgi:excisionase family DNA binding protein
MSRGKQNAPLLAHELERVQEAVKVLLEHKIGAHEFASLAGTAYPIPKEKDPVLLTAKQAAARWGISYWTLRRWVLEGRLRPITGGKGWLFKPEDIEGALKRL